MRLGRRNCGGDCWHHSAVFECKWWWSFLLWRSPAIPHLQHRSRFNSRFHLFDYVYPQPYLPLEVSFLTFYKCKASFLTEIDSKTYRLMLPPPLMNLGLVRGFFFLILINVNLYYLFYNKKMCLFCNWFFNLFGRASIVFAKLIRVFLLLSLPLMWAVRATATARWLPLVALS